MTSTTIQGGSSRRFSKRRLGAASAAVALVATGAVTALGAGSFANDAEGGAGALPPPGEQSIGEGDLVIGSSELIRTGGSTFDDTVVSKFFPAAGFSVFQGVADEADLFNNTGPTCFYPGAGSGGNVTQFYGGLELPDGSRIKRVSFYGKDSSATLDISIVLARSGFFTPFGLNGSPASSTLEQVTVDAFSTSGSQSDGTVVFGTNDLDELVGSPSLSGIIAGFTARFHTLRVDMANAAGSDHLFCGIRVDYEVPAPADPGTVFHPVGPVRVFDSRQGSFAASGPLGPNQTKVIDITDGYDSSGVAIPAQNDVVPSSATAVAYNITVAGATGPNFVAVTPGDATEFAASAINYSSGPSIANGSTVTLAGDDTIKLWGGGNTGSAHVIIDIVGYYAPPVNVNMAN